MAAGPSLFRPNNIPGGLQLYLKLDEASGTRSDSSGNGNHFTDNNTVMSVATDYWKTGENSALFVAANSEYLSRTDAAQVGLEFNGTSFTIAAFLKPNSFGGQSVILGKNAASADGYLFYCPAGDTRLNVYLNGSLYQSAAGVVAAGRRTHVAMVRDTANNRLLVYANGNLVLTAAGTAYHTATDVLAGNSEPVQIGKYGTSASYLDGELKDLAAWSVALSPIQIKSLALGIDLATYGYRPGNVSVSPSHWYKLNEPSNAAGAVNAIDYAVSGGINLTDTNTVTCAGGYFEGVGRHFTTANSEYFTGSGFASIGTGDFSYSFKAKFTTVPTQPAFGGRGSAPDANSHLMTYYANQFYWYVGGVAKVWTWTPVTGVVYDIVVKRSGTALSVWVDGVSLGGSNTSSANITNTNLSIGNDTVSSTNRFDGEITDFAEWIGYALTDEEIKSLACGMPIQQQGIVSYFKLDEASGTRADSIGGNNLTDNNTVLQGTGKVNGSADFELSNSEWLSITDGAQSGLDLTTDFGVLGWINAESSAANAALISKWNGSTGYALRMSSANVFRLEIDGTGLETTDTLADATWGHIVGRWDGATRAIFIDSKQSTSGAQTAAPSDVAHDFNLGRYNSASEGFDGLMDEVLIMKRWPRDEEIKAVYNKGRCGKEATSSEVAVATGNFFAFF